MTSGIAFMPPPRLKFTAWLSAPSRSVDAEVATLLRMSMFRRLEAVLVGATATPMIAMIAFYRHPLPEFAFWLVCEVLLSAFRFAIVISIMRHVKRRAEPGVFSRWNTDLFIITGTLWSGLQGLGNILIIPLDDPGLVLLLAFMSLVTIAAQSIRNPSSCRMNNVQMCLVIVPFSIGVLSSPIALVRWDIIFGPVYLLTMMNLTRQIHEDYIAMIVAQIENRRHAMHCPLTGLPNRRFFDESLRETLAGEKIIARTLSVLCIDLDGFKAVNDRFGHPVGDSLLIQVAKRLSSATRAGDMTARLGGDEFAVLLHSDDQATAEILAARINSLIAEPFVLASDITVTIGASVGIWSADAGADARSIDANLVMMLADQALYAAKHAGKGTFRRSVSRAPAPAVISQPFEMEGMRLAS